MKKPNVIILFTDQQSLRAMSAAGNRHLNTPNMDYIAHNGVLFKNSYCTAPVCGPARASIFTGVMPHEHGVEYNSREIIEDVPTMGEIFRNPALKDSEYVVTELQPFKYEYERIARMLRSRQYKYIACSEGENSEMLFDMINDPGEMNNLASNPEMKETLETHRELLKEWIFKTKDHFSMLDLQV